MPVAEADRISLYPPWLGLAVVPALVILGSDLLVYRFGWPVEPTAPLALAFNEHLEAAARMQAVAMTLLVCFAGLATFSYFLTLAWRADNRTRLWLGGAFALLAAIGAAFLAAAATEGRQTQQLTDQRLYCAAAHMPPLPTTAPSEPAACEARHFEELRELFLTQRVAIFLAIISIVLGSILCLGERSPPPHDAAFVATQIDRLNLVLYLAAFMLVSGLLFLSAFLHYPTYALGEEASKPYRQAARAVVLFYGISYSLFIAACYMPVAALLTRRPLEAAPAAQPAPSPVSDAVLTTSQLLKIALAVLSPVITSLLGEVFKLPGG